MPDRRPRIRDEQAPYGRKIDGTPRRRPGPANGPRKFFSPHPYRSKGWWADYRNQNKEILNARSREWAAKNPERSKELKNSWQKKNPEIKCATAARRRSKRLSATPPWADHKAISAVYRECKKINKTSSVKMVVDHVVPLQGKNVCGLHVHWNLRVISESENSKKQNRFIEELALAPTIANGLLKR